MVFPRHGGGGKKGFDLCMSMHAFKCMCVYTCLCICVYMCMCIYFFKYAYVLACCWGYGTKYICSKM